MILGHSCEKEDAFIEEESIVTESINPHQPSTLRLVEAKNVFSSSHLREKSNEKSLYDVVPLWDSAREILFQGKDTILLVPYWFKENIVQSSHENIYLAFFDGDQGVMDFGVIGFESTEEELVDRSLDVLDGYLFVGRKDFSVSHVAEVINGQLIRVAYDEGRVVFDQTFNLAGAGAKSCEENLVSFNPWDWLLNLFRDGVRCPGMGGDRKPRNSRSNWLSNFFDGIGSAFGANTGNTATSQLNNGMTFWEIFGRVYTTRGGITTISNGPGGGGLNTNPSGGPGGPLNLSDFYENLEQAPVVQDLVNLLNECLTDSEDQQAALDLIQDEYLQCLDHFGEIGNPNLLIQQYLCTAAKVLDQLEFRDLSSSCAVNRLKARTLQIFSGSNIGNLAKLQEHPALIDPLWTLVARNGFDESSQLYLSDMIQFLNEYNFSSEVIDLVISISAQDDYITSSVNCEDDPCLCNVLEKLQFGFLIATVPKMIFKIFGTSSAHSIEITTSEIEGATIADTVWAVNRPIASPGGDFTTSVIIFNSNKEMDCTEVSLAATLLHEALHSFLHHERETLGLTQFNLTYPLYASGGDHEIMATTYVEEVASSLQRMYPSLDSTIANNLAWGGLGGTQAFAQLGAAKRQAIYDTEQLATCATRPSPNNLQSPSAALAERRRLGMYPCF